jgi:2-oxoglutarate dehydrogenase E2 component (dihydrolipoamide succinyltransferase)
VAELRVPKLNSNDDSYVLTGWLVKDGEPVRAGDALAELETSKAVEELTACASGPLHHLAAQGATILPGQLIATIGQPGIAESRSAAPIAEAAGTALAGAAQLITGPARQRMTELGVSEEQVRALATRVVRSGDIDELAATAQSAEIVDGQRLSKVQVAVGRAVSRSHNDIPAAYTVVKVEVGPALGRARELMRQVRRPVGLAELFVLAVAQVFGRFPVFFGQLSADASTVGLAVAPHIGVTVDLGEGLYVPVLHHAHELTIGEIASKLMQFRLAAAEGTFRAADLAGANIAVTLHTDPGVVLAIPFIFPGQLCALAITSPQEEVVLVNGEVSSRTIAQIGLAYDHRAINGREAAAFLTAVGEALS